MSKLNISVTVVDDQLSRLSEIASACEKAGMTVTGTLDAIGVLTGTIDADKLDVLRRVPGIGQVEQSREIYVAPPEHDVQ